MSAFFTFLLVLALAVVLGWHFGLPLLGGLIAITSGAWAILIASVIFLCVAIMLIFIFTGTGIFILSIFAFIWTAIAIALFPVLLPIIAPIFIIFMLISYMRRKRKREDAQLTNKKSNGAQ